jgi:hypothetical protein
MYSTQDFRQLILSTLHTVSGGKHAACLRSAMNTVISGLPRHFVQVCFLMLCTRWTEIS